MNRESAQLYSLHVTCLSASTQFHPDMVSSKSSVEEMVAVNVAYSVLSKPVERTDYDRRMGFDRYTTSHTEDG